MRTERLFLRPIFPEDWREIYRGIADFGVVRMLARAPWPYRAEHAVAYCRQPRPANMMVFSVTLPELTGAPVIGQIGLEPSVDGHELGYWIGRRWQRRGYASEAVRGVLDMAQALGIRRVVAGHYLDNAASSKVMRANGFAETGEMRPVACLARGGELVLSRRYERQLAVVSDEMPAQAA